MSKCKRIRRRQRSLLVLGLGYFHLPPTVDEVDRWRQAMRASSGVSSPERAVLDELATLMADAITTGRGAVDDADIDGMVIIHWPEAGNTVLHARQLARALHVTEGMVWQSLRELADAGILTPCGRRGCEDAGYDATVRPQEIFDVEFDGITAVGWP